jgi:hypothetical protein
VHLDCRDAVLAMHPSADYGPGSRPVLGIAGLLLNMPNSVISTIKHATGLADATADQCARVLESHWVWRRARISSPSC